MLPDRNVVPDRPETIAAQLRLLEDPRQARRGVYLPPGQEMPGNLPGKACARFSDGSGMIYNDGDQEAAVGCQLLQEALNQGDERIKQFLIGLMTNIGTGKPDTDSVVQVRDRQGTVVQEALADMSSIDAAQDVVNELGGWLEFTTAQNALRGRK
jgi:hypothetical protein